VYVLAVHCGLRQGELLGLKWEDVDLPSGVLRVRRTLSVAKDGPIFNPPKTAKGRRTVALTDGAASALEAHLWRRLSQAEVLGDDDYLARP
jgi:integrase